MQLVVSHTVRGLAMPWQTSVPKSAASEHEICGEQLVHAVPLSFVDDMSVECQKLVDGEGIGNVHRILPHCLYPIERATR